ncbi:hypothetical protein XENOCAPTIV_030581 [Xenoophorus captivus]|uniref:Uncharacterized protein n=1 Tax=Xenoophorus captivus TaxID=1517983 RepID=A0ABV0RD96_9TELE
MSLDCGRKPEYPVRTHTCTGRTCKLHAERPPTGNQTQDLLAARQQCYQLRHHAALHLFHINIKIQHFTVISFYNEVQFGKRTKTKQLSRA